MMLHDGSAGSPQAALHPYHTLKLLSTTKVLAKRMPKNYRISLFTMVPHHQQATGRCVSVRFHQAAIGSRSADIKPVGAQVPQKSSQGSDKNSVLT